jgi:hypothetical protein
LPNVAFFFAYNLPNPKVAFYFAYNLPKAAF